MGAVGQGQHELTLALHSPELTYQEVLSFKPAELPQSAGGLDIEQ